MKCKVEFEQMRKIIHIVCMKVLALYLYIEKSDEGEDIPIKGKGKINCSKQDINSLILSDTVDRIGILGGDMLQFRIQKQDKFTF